MGKPERKKHLEDLGVNGRIIVKLKVKKGVCKAWTGLIRLKTGTSGGLF